MTMVSPRRRRGRQAGPARAILYVRVSSEEQVKSGLSLEDQRATLRSEAERGALGLQAQTALHLLLGADAHVEDGAGRAGLSASSPPRRHHGHGSRLQQ